MNRFPTGLQLLFSVFVLLLVDAGISCLTGFSSLSIIAVTRFCQIISLSLILWFSSQGLKALGLSAQKILPGIRKGIFWSVLISCFVLVTGIVLYLSGIDPILLIIPVSLNVKNNFLLFLITSCFLSPIFEELFFRGFVFSYFRKFGFLPAMITSAFFFSVCHFSQGSLPWVQFSGGLLFAVSFEYSKSLASPIVIHVLANIAIIALGLTMI